MGPGEIVIIILAGLAAGFTNTIAGGGSLLTLPALMLAGLPADVANGTNRVAILLQSASAARGFQKAGELPWRRGLGLLLPTGAGALVGASVASRLPNTWLEPILLGTLVMVAIAVALGGGRATAGGQARSARARDHAALFVAGIYGGFIQAGLGFLLLALLHGGLRLDLIKANAVKVMIAGGLTLVALAVFIWADQVRWGPGVLLGVSSVVGARIGVRFALASPPRHLRWAILGCVLLSCALILGR